MTARRLAERLTQGDKTPTFRLGVVVAVPSAGTCTVDIGGPGDPDRAVACRHLSSYAPAVGDDVWVHSNQGDLWVVGTLGAPDSGPGTPPDFYYEHTQSMAAAVWTINHNLGGFPSITVVDSAGSTVIGTPEYVSDNQVRVHFAAPFSGKAYAS